MSVTVDVDEADIAVLNQNLVKSKELFSTISRSLNKISTKTSTASIKIKPILRDVNKLNQSKTQLESGLELLTDVSSYASKASEYEAILHNSVELIGVRKFVDTLVKSKALLQEMKANIKRFKGILINFETLIDKSDLVLQNYFQKLFHQETPKLNEIIIIFQYFYTSSASGKTTISRILGRSQSSKLTENMARIQSSTKPLKRSSNIPYEKGSNGINRYNNELIRAIKSESSLLSEISGKVAISNEERAEMLKEVTLKVVDEDYANIVQDYQQFFHQHKVLDNDIFALEVVENLSHFENFLETMGIGVDRYPTFKERYQLLLLTVRDIFRELIEYTETKIKNIEKFSDLTVTETVVEMISRMRKLSELSGSLLKLMQGVKLGSWLNTKPPTRFISVYTSVIPNVSEEIDESKPEHLLLCYTSDFIDCVMINVEIGLKLDINTKKSTQGYYLVKNLVMIETIINRTQSMYTNLGNLGTERIAKLKKRFLKLFLDDWNYASYIIIRDMTSITTSNAVSGHTGTSMSSKEKEQVKELFRSFNESFEDALRNYDKHNITEPTLRSYLASEIKKLIINAYFKLYDKYGQSDFTKNKQKYVKYNKQQFEQILNERL